MDDDAECCDDRRRKSASAEGVISSSCGRLGARLLFQVQNASET